MSTFQTQMMANAKKQESVTHTQEKKVTETTHISDFIDKNLKTAII